jgi:alpha-beta hydrolase superfamily lysophospholipase
MARAKTICYRYRRSVETDILGPPYECRRIELGHDGEGPVSATLVRRLADAPARSAAAVLYLHGFVDYFFQTHLADFYVGRGIDFYALDLRKYGRSLADHQTPHRCVDLTDYYPEIDAAVRIIRESDDHRVLLVNGHSLGGLIAALWTADRRGPAGPDALFLNSPFLDFNGSWLLRRPVAALTAGVATVAPMVRVPVGLNEVYGRSIHHGYRGAWHYDLAWKPLAGVPVRAGWVRAVRAGQRRVRAGLEIDVPVLVAASTTSFTGTRWDEAATAADTVLEVATIARWVPSLGRHVSLARIDGGLHDLVLSAEPQRSRVFDVLGTWLDGYLPVRPDAEGPHAEGPHAEGPHAEGPDGRTAPSTPHRAGPEAGR